MLGLQRLQGRAGDAASNSAVPANTIHGERFTSTSVSDALARGGSSVRAGGRGGERWIGRGKTVLPLPAPVRRSPGFGGGGGTGGVSRRSSSSAASTISLAFLRSSATKA